MTITVITGTPGAGKTLHAIEKLLIPIVGSSIPQEVDGVMTFHPRVIYTNIKGLLIDHVLIDGGDNQGLRDWHLWAQPGAVICFDEVQKIWPPRPAGSKVPDDIQALETHRHMGVDFILITQNVMLVDRNMQALTNRHLHVRRMANLGLAIVYEWDHCSKGLLYTKAITKSPWKYNKKVFKLYHSSDLHTKQPRSLPGLLWFVLLGLVVLALLGPAMYKRMQERFNPQQVAVASAKPGQPLSSSAQAAPRAFGSPAGGSAGPAAGGSAGILPDERIDFNPRIVSRPWTAPAYDHLRRVVSMPTITSAACVNQDCKCYHEKRVLLEVSAESCYQWALAPSFDPYTAQIPDVQTQDRQVKTAQLAPPV